MVNSFDGDIKGEGTLEYLMVYRDDSSGSFLGLEHLVGRLGGRVGSFVLQHSGTFEGDTVEATWFVVPGSGTGERRTPFTLDYDFERWLAAGLGAACGVVTAG